MAIAETTSGLLLLVLITLVAQSYGVRPSVLPFLAASIASGEPYLGLLRRLGSSPKRISRG